MSKVEQKKPAQNPLRLWLGIALVLVGLLAVANGVSSLLDNKSRLIAPEGVITIETVDTPESRTKGLSGRAGLSDAEGMMFVFDTPSAGNCFWMKDMLFVIDMVWLDEEKNVITVIPSVSPDTYPDSFCPGEDAKFGLEIGDQRAEALGITVGEQLRF